MPEREPVEYVLNQEEEKLRARFDELWHDVKDKSPHDMLLELLAGVLYPKEVKKPLEAPKKEK